MSVFETCVEVQVALGRQPLSNPLKLKRTSDKSVLAPPSTEHTPSGRKSDVRDYQWLQYLHSVGMLRGSFLPPQDIYAIRNLARHRESLLAQAADRVRHMQKCLDQMNLQIHPMINDLTGATGMAIIEAIVQSERDPRRAPARRAPRPAHQGERADGGKEPAWRLARGTSVGAAFGA